MPDKKSSDTSDDAKGGPKKLIMSGVICVVLIAVGYVVGGKLSAAPAATAAEGEVEEVEEEAVVGLLIPLDAININLADGRYLRIAISLGVDEHVELVDSHGKEIEFPSAPAADVVLTTFSGMTMADLATLEGREKARHHLIESMEPYYGEDVIAVYFTEFVMQ